MYNYLLYKKIDNKVEEARLDIGGEDRLFYTRLLANASDIYSLYGELYSEHEKGALIFEQLVEKIIYAYRNRSAHLKQKDINKQEKGNWFLSNEMAGMSLYVDRFCGNLKNLNTKLDYFETLGINLLHLMPLFQSPEGESDGGYAVSDFRKVDNRFGTLEHLQALQMNMSNAGMYLMLDIVLNHTSHLHEWALKAKQGNKIYQEYFYMYDERTLPDAFDATMPDIFPESSPGNFTYVKECDKWVMTVFHNYQWDLNYTNPLVFVEMLGNIFFYANIGVDILRIDAPAFIWKQLGTTCQNLPKAHTILRLIKQCVEVATPGMALLGEAIVAPKEIMKYFGTETYKARECDFAYNATLMALQWDALASGDTRVMMAAQGELLQKPFGTSWITYTRSHDDIGLGYEDYMIEQAGFNAYVHRKFLKEYYSGNFYNSPAKGALFSYNPKTQDARISGSLASLCGLEKALEENNKKNIQLSIKKILLMQAHSFFVGGLPMLFYGDETGCTNDYSYLNDEGKSYDNRWMHRSVINWERNKKIAIENTVEQQIFSATRQLLALRKNIASVADLSNIKWFSTHNIHISGYVRELNKQRLYCVFNFSNQLAYLTWYVFKEHGLTPEKLIDRRDNKVYEVGQDHEYLIIEPYNFHLMQQI